MFLQILAQPYCRQKEKQNKALKTNFEAIKNAKDLDIFNLFIITL